MEKLGFDDEIEYSFDKNRLCIEAPGYAKRKIETVIDETKFTQPYIKIFSYDTLFEGVEEQSFTNDVDLYMSQILPSCLKKIDFGNDSVSDYRLHIFRLKKKN